MSMEEGHTSPRSEVLRLSASFRPPNPVERFLRSLPFVPPFPGDVYKFEQNGADKYFQVKSLGGTEYNVNRGESFKQTVFLQELSLDNGVFDTVPQSESEIPVSEFRKQKYALFLLQKDA